MPLLLNLRDLEDQDVVLDGEIPVEDLGFDFNDDIIHFTQPLKYHLNAQSLDDALLIRGKLELTLDCECARCVKPFDYPIEFPDWVCHIPTEGEEKAQINKGSVDLTPYIREDMVLAFPQHPLCREDCPGLDPQDQSASVEPSIDAEKKSPWDQLNRLKL